MYRQTSGVNDCTVVLNEIGEIDGHHSRTIGLTGTVEGKEVELTQLIIEANKTVCITFTVASTEYAEKMLDAMSSVHVLENQLDEDFGGYGGDEGYTYDWEIKPEDDTPENALEEAKNSLETMPYSYKGMIEILEFIGYSTENATYGADNCGADWNEEAIRYAEWIDRDSEYTSEQLLDSLEYAGFTHEQAEAAIK